MHEIHCLEEIADDIRSTFLCKRLSAGNDVIELPVAAEFHDRVEILLVAEISIIFDDIWMIQKTLYLQFSDELNQQVVPYDSFLLHDLQGDDHARVDLLGQEDATEFSLA
jgi:hypothetical protein